MKQHEKVFRVGLAVALSWLVSDTAFATLPLQKKAKEAGYPATSCLYCHNEKLPKKGAATANARGTFLLAEKDKRKAAEVDVRWLEKFAGKAEAEAPAAATTAKPRPTLQPRLVPAPRPTTDVRPTPDPRETPDPRATGPEAPVTPCPSSR